MMRSVEWLDLLTQIYIISSIGSEHYSDMAQPAEGRAIFIESCVEMLVQHNFDGLDLDWEYPGGREDSPGNHCFDFKFFLKMDHSQPLCLYFCLFFLNAQLADKILPMSVFDPQIFGVRSDHSTN